jgi:hypothetical protein
MERLIKTENWLWNINLQKKNRWNWKESVICVVRNITRKMSYCTVICKFTPYSPIFMQNTSCIHLLLTATLWGLHEHVPICRLKKHCEPSYFICLEMLTTQFWVGQPKFRPLYYRLSSTVKTPFCICIWAGNAASLLNAGLDRALTTKRFYRNVFTVKNYGAKE